MPRSWRGLSVVAVTCVVAAAIFWSWERYGVGRVNSIVGIAASVIGVLGFGGLWPLWRWALRRGDSDSAGDDARSRAVHRQRLAGNIERQLILAYGQDEWDDGQYAELKAEFQVDAIRPEDIPWWQSLIGRDRLLRHERSLTRAMLRMHPRIVILEGEPGCGKSVAMRHLALRLAHRHRRRKRGPLPVYVNLKDFRPAARRVDSESVREFVHDTLISQDSGIERFLEAGFGEAPGADSWLVLFDSFDEIPAVLGATEADKTVQEYAKAIIDFTENRGFRAVIASREFRGPRGLALPRLRITPLTSRQQQALIRRSGLPPDMAATAITEITRAGPDLRQLIGNPLFLWLVCRYLRDNNGMFPQSAHSVFDSYVGHRLTADETRIREKFRLEAGVIRSYAEQFAFSMASSPGLGLTPAIGQLQESVLALPTTSSLQAQRVPAVLKALEELKLGRCETSPGESGVERFTFAHRRLQEYFATCVVFSRPQAVPPTTLLTDGRWRETAVATFQSRPPEVIDRLLEVLRGELTPLRDQVLQSAGSFRWPPNLLHLLDVLAAGLGRTPERIPDDIRAIAGQVLARAWDTGLRYDKLWAIDEARVAPGRVTDVLLVLASNSSSHLLQEAALQQATWLNQIPPAAEAGLRRLAVFLWASGDLSGRSRVITAQLRHLPQPTTLLPALRLLRAIVPGEIVSLILIAGYMLTAFGHGLAGIVLLVTLVIAHARLRLMRAAITDPGPRSATIRAPYKFWVLVLRRAKARFRAKATYLRSLGFYAGICPLITLIVIGGSRHAAHVGFDALVIGWFATAYLLMWPRAAVSQVLAGGRAPLWIWPLLPVRWIGRGVLRAVRIFRKIPLRVKLSVLAYYSIPIAYISIVISTLSVIGASSQSSTNVLVWAILIPIAGLGCVVDFMAIRRLVIRRRLRKRRRQVLKEASRRTEPYTAGEIATALVGIRTSSAVRELAETLRRTPELCPPEVIEVFVDLLNTAEGSDYRTHDRRRVSALLTRRRPPLAVPSSCGPTFTALAESAPGPLNELLLALNEETLDEITRLIDTCRKSSPAAP
jgi:hypothetical protein